MAKKGPSIHVVPSASVPGKFVTKEAGNPKPLTRPASQADTIKKAIPFAKENKSEVVTTPLDECQEVPRTARTRYPAWGPSPVRS